MGRRMWRGLRERGAPALTRPVDPGRADSDGLGTAEWEPAAAPRAGPAGPGAPRPVPPAPRTGPGDTGAPAAPRAARQVPGWLERAAGWSWRLLIVDVLIYVLFRLV